MPFYNRQSQKVFPLLTPIVSASELLLTREGTQIHIMSTSRERMETTDAEEGLQLTLPSTTLQKKSVSWKVETWWMELFTVPSSHFINIMLQCKKNPFVKETSFGDVLQGPICKIVHSCWRSIWIHLWPPCSRAPTKITSYHLYLLVVLTYLVEISLPCTNKNNIISPLPPSGSDISGWNLPFLAGTVFVIMSCIYC